MGKARQPVSINGLEFDALISEDLTLENTVPEYAVETGFSVSDAVIHAPEKLNMVLYLTNTPVTWRRQHGASPYRVDGVVDQLKELYYTGDPVTIVTTDATYTSMAIESIQISKSLETGYAREIPISFKKIRVTSAKTASIPDSYGKSGTTGASAGTANTSAGSGGSGGSSGGSGGSGDKAGGNSKSSILYGAASSMGLL